MDPEIIRQFIREELATLIKSDRYTFEKPVQFLDGRGIQTGRTAGTKIGTASDQKLGFFGATPIVQPTLPGSPVLSDVVTVIKNLGLSN